MRRLASMLWPAACSVARPRQAAASTHARSCACQARNNCGWAGRVQVGRRGNLGAACLARSAGRRPKMAGQLVVPWGEVASGPGSVDPVLRMGRDREKEERDKKDKASLLVGLHVFDASSTPQKQIYKLSFSKEKSSYLNVFLTSK